VHSGKKRADGGERAFDLNEDPAGRVEYKSRKPMAARQVVNPWTEADTLDDAANAQLAPDCG